MPVGEAIKTAGWRQGKIIAPADAQRLFDSSENECVIVVSQSCDLVHHDKAAEPLFFAIVARELNEFNGNFAHGKHPRKFHVHVYANDGTSKPYELVPHALDATDRSELTSCVPDTDRYLRDRDIDEIANWLARRFKRAAFPDEFNNRLNTNQLRKLGNRVSAKNSGLYVDLEPNGEVTPDSVYHVNLLALVSPNIDPKDLPGVEAEIKALAESMGELKMDVKFAVRSETDVSVAVMRRFKHMPALEELSFGAPEHPQPP